MEIEEAPKLQTGETKFLKAFWLGIASAFWSCLAIVACVAASINTSGRGALSIMFAIPAIELGSAAVLVHLSAVPIPCPSLDSGGEYILVSSVLTYVLMMIRLVCAGSFGGNTVNFNFGKDCEEGECVPDVAFVFNFDSITHILQGCLFFLLYRDIIMGFRSVRKTTVQRCLFIKEFLGLMFCVYPSYSLLKRILKQTDVTETFASTSHFSNTSEWACGFVIGACAIFPFYASLYSKYHIVVPEIPREDRCYTVFRICRISGGVSLLISFLVALILLAVSWNKDYDL